VDEILHRIWAAAPSVMQSMVCAVIQIQYNANIATIAGILWLLHDPWRWQRLQPQIEKEFIDGNPNHDPHPHINH
jgi:hypothetical protein